MAIKKDFICDYYALNIQNAYHRIASIRADFRIKNKVTIVIEIFANESARRQDKIPIGRIEHDIDTNEFIVKICQNSKNIDDIIKNCYIYLNENNIITGEEC